MITQSDEEIEEELASSIVHFKLHGPAALECASAADYEREVVSAEFGIGVGSVGVGVACG